MTGIPNGVFVLLSLYGSLGIIDATEEAYADSRFWIHAVKLVLHFPRRKWKWKWIHGVGRCRTIIHGDGQRGREWEWEWEGMAVG
jgi:hypothetical protein